MENIQFAPLLIKPSIEWIKKYYTPKYISTTVDNITVIESDDAIAVTFYNHKINLYVKIQPDDTKRVFKIGTDEIQVAFENNIPNIFINKQQLNFGC